MPPRLLARVFELADRLIVRLFGEKMLRPIRFLAVGSSGSVVAILFWDLLYRLGAHEAIPIPGAGKYAPLDLLSLEMGLLWNYVFHEMWTFADLNLPSTAKARIARLASYHGTSAVSWVTVLAVHMALVSIGIHPLLGFILAKIIGFLINYTLASRLAWGKNLPWHRTG